MAEEVPGGMVIDPDEVQESLRENERQRDQYLLWKAKWLREQGIVRAHEEPAE